MNLLRLINWQGLAGIAVAFTLMAMLTAQKFEALHWKKQSDSFERLYQQEQAAFATTVASARMAADQARADDKANSERVAAEQNAINQRTEDEFEVRLTAARADAQRLRLNSKAAAVGGAGGNASVSVVPSGSGGAAHAARQDGLPASDALIATEQAIQLDELVKWVRDQAAVQPNSVR